MALRLVNTDPGVGSADLIPGKPIQLGLRSETGTVIPGTFRASMGYTGLVHGGVLPEDDQTLIAKDVQVQLESTERRRPVSGETTNTISSGSLLITKDTNSDTENCVYELTTPIDGSTSALAYFKFRTKTAWQTLSPDWCNLANMTGMYFGLEHGGLNTACYAFLRSPGSLVIGGPLPSYGSARPGQQEFGAFNWGALPDNSQVEVWIYFNIEGYPSPFVPPGVPLIEVWTRRVGVDAAPVVHLQTAIGVLGEFPDLSTSFSNLRTGPSNEYRLYIGNAGRTGDILQVDDWALFKDFRRAANVGQPASMHNLTVNVDSPLEYRADAGVVPKQSSPSRWFDLSVAGAVPPVQSLYVQPGKTKPLYTVLKKEDASISGVEREEPRLEQVVDGFSVEAFMAAKVTDTFGKVLGSGIGVEDGADLYQVVAIDTPVRTLGISKDLTDPQDLDASFHMPVSEIDWRSLKLVRLTLDRRRSRLLLDVDGTRVIDIPSSSTVPSARVAYGRVFFGNLLSVDDTGELQVSFLKYLTRYKAWESADLLEPPAALVSTPGPAFTLQDAGVGATTFANGLMVIDKTDFSVAGSKRFYSKLEDISSVQGVQVEFEMKVTLANGPLGNLFNPNQDLGVGVRLYLGDKVVNIGMFDCGLGGRVIGIVPGSEGSDGIVNRTTVGKTHSTGVDWLQSNRYTVVYKPFDSIKLWIGTVAGPPAITIPWRDDTDGFDLPLDISSPAVAFGHFSEDTASKTEWGFFRWGQGNGHDIELTQKYEDGLKSHHFGGKSFVLTEFDE